MRCLFQSGDPFLESGKTSLANAPIANRIQIHLAPLSLADQQCLIEVRP
jgi:hypothetical protein